jgi:rare lipoprotein A
VPMRRTIGISLAFLMVSTGVMGKTREGDTSHQRTGLHHLKPATSEPWLSRSRHVCDGANARHSAHHSRRARYRLAARLVEGGPDAYLGSGYAGGRIETGQAAWYSLVGNYTSNGERLDMVTPTAAHRSLPLASYAKVTSLDNGRSVIVKINDRGPRTRKFIIDLSPRAAEEIDMKRSGVAAVIVEPVVAQPIPIEAQAPTIAVYQGSANTVAQ